MWGRSVRIEITSKGSTILATDGLRVDFSYIHSWGLNDIATLQIFNLSRETFKTLTASTVLDIKLYVGHKDEGELSLLLDGVINNVWGQKSVPNHITHVYCVPKSLYLASGKTPVPRVTDRETSIAEHLNALSKAMGMGEVKFSSSARDKTYDRIAPRASEHTLYMELDKVGRENGLKIRLKNDQMYVTANPTIVDAVDRAAADEYSTNHILDTAGLRGTPKLTTSRVEIPYLLAANFYSGDIVDLGVPSVSNSVASVAEVSGLGQNLNRSEGLIESVISRYYMINKIEHLGSVYTDKWQSIIHGTTYRVNTLGE